MTTCLVTGGAGFIGSHLVRALLQRGDRVRVLDNFSTGKAENLSGLNGRVEVVVGDLRDAAGLKRAAEGAELIFHHAAMVSVPQSMEDPQTCLDINVQGTVNVLEAARHTGARRVVLVSSAAVYGDADDFPLGERAALRPLSPYAASKQMNEVYGGMYTRAFGLPVVALRYFNVFGPRQSPDSAYAAAVPIFIRRLLAGQAPTIFGDGTQRRDFIFVEDAVHANLLAADQPGVEGETFNICTGCEVSLLDLLETLYGILPGAPEPQYAPPRPGDIVRSLGDPSRASQALGFRPRVDLAEGLRRSVEWAQHGEKVA